MRKIEVETWTLRIVDQLRAGSPVEDSRVELKREWPKPAKVARQVAGHANAARGEDILWLIGVDEKAREVVGAEANGFAEWWNQVQSEFNELAPRLMELLVPVGGVAVYALLFETDRAPFVVKNPDGGPIGHEVPWREGTSVRSARRADLLRLLAPLQDQPHIEVLDLALCSGVSPAQPAPWWKIDGHLYVTPARPGVQLVFPHHRLAAEVEFSNRARLAFKARATCTAATATNTAGELVLTAPTMIELKAWASSADAFDPGPALVELHLRPAGTHHAIKIPVRVQPSSASPEERARWCMLA
jgi:hypothetical protein